MQDNDYDYQNAPVTEPYARDLVLEAQRLMEAQFPISKELVFVEFFEIMGFALVSEDKVVFYHPAMIKELPLNTVCECLYQVFHAYAMKRAELESEPVDLSEHLPPPGTTLH